MTAVYLDGHTEKWPEQLPEDVYLWQTVNDGTGQIDYFARWDTNIFVQINEAMWRALVFISAVNE